MMLPLLNDTVDSCESLKKLAHSLSRTHPVQKDIELLLTVLEDPLLRTVLQIKNSLDDLRVLVQRHPSILPRDFDILRDGSLEYSCDTDSANPSASHEITSVVRSDVAGGAASTSLSSERFLAVELIKEGPSLGFSVLGVTGEDDEVSIFIKEIQPDGIADRDGRLNEGDKIVAINGTRLSGVGHGQVVSLLQQTQGLVTLLVDRQQQHQHLQHQHLQHQQQHIHQQQHHHHIQQQIHIENNKQHQQQQQHNQEAVTHTAQELSPEMVLNTEWAQVEAVELVNDGSGLGFGIIGGRSTGVVVKTILPGGVADRDGRLLSGDHILQIGEVNLRGMGSEQVAAVLRQSGVNVRLVVARPVDASVAAGLEGLAAPVVPTRILADAEEIERHLAMFSNNNNSLMDDSSLRTTTPGTDTVTVVEQLPIAPSTVSNVSNPSQETVPPDMQKELLSLMGLEQLPEMETFEVELMKDQQGLGITIAGYVCEKGKDEEISGVFVKSIARSSAADLNGQIRVNDQVIEVDGRPLQGYTNHQAVEVLRSTGKVVKLRLARYLRGARYDQLQQAIQAEAGGVPLSLIIKEKTQTPLKAASNAAANLSAPIRNAHIGALSAATPLATETGEAEKRWKEVFGDEFIIVIAQLCKFHEGGGLGISLEGTVDVNEQGEEVRPHHYIRSILPDGPVGLNSVLRSGDELVEVNGKQLLGLDHRDVVNTLKDLPLNVEMICARPKNCPLPSAGVSSQSKAKSDTSLNRYSSEDDDGALGVIGTAGAGGGGLSKLKLRSRSLEPLSGLAMWSNEAHVIQLHKAERGLGFSILDYQDPMNPNETVIVIRSLVPGGVAQQDGRLIPGDRLLFVNDVNLENATLDTAVQTLKGAAKGPVKIGVAKPLPLPCPHEGTQHHHDPNSSNLAALVKSESF